MKLLFFSSDYKIGLSSLLTKEVNAFNRASIPLIGIMGEKEQEFNLREQLDKNNVSYYLIEGLDKHDNFKTLANQIKEIIEKEKITHVHVQNNWQLALVSYVKFFAFSRGKWKIIYSIHGFRHNHPLKAFIARCVIGCSLFFFADKIICMSDYVKKKFSFLSYKIVFLYLGIDDVFFEEKENCINIEELRVISPAQFRYGKNQDLLITAFSNYVAKSGDKSSMLYLPGEGDLKDKCRELSKALNIEEQVVFSGQLSKPELSELYKKTNIAVNASNSETFGQSIVEPFVLGRCVLTRRVGVADEIIKEGQNGYFFDNEKDLEALFFMLSKNKNKIQEIGNNNFERRDMFSWSIIAEQYRDKVIFSVCG